MTLPGAIGKLFVVAASALVVAAPAVAQAAMPPGGAPLVAGGQALVDYLINALGPILMILGVIGAAISVLFGNREGLGKFAAAFAAGALIFAAPMLVEFTRSIFSR